ncbi:tRNA lysidine(34) synthetase TilS [Diaminobutyricimonas sp. LJ205]|uniref:tRNA lysidine(34) synthetase TilS n=1 Tax=Diaminobutyricimonas sp. LJ205 TaxID=2683590 RepID=UPI0012F4BCA3|nr:tRNA lysidine(34) synthetase TilS [Diaminobutyricimonas sp. LJ205]
MHSAPPESGPRRPRLTPAIADVRRAVRATLSSELAENASPGGGRPAFSRGEASGLPLVLVALSGGADSLALAAATAFEAPRAGFRAGAVIVDHGLQEGSADVAARAARQATQLGLDPVQISRVMVGREGGPEAAARTARYDELTVAAVQHGATAVLLGHTLDDQAETVLLGLARGSGATSLQGMAASLAVPVPAASANDWRIELPDGLVNTTSRAPGAGERELLFLRPLLGIRRVTTAQFCDDSGLDYWTDPHNSEHAYTRVRVRERVLPLLEDELGPGIAEALVRTAEQLREDAAALDHFAEEVAEELAEVAEAGISLPVGALAANPPALRHRLIRLAVQSEFHLSLSRAHTLEVARLVTDWHGQGPLDLPGIRVERADGLIVFTAARATG